jgi:hypothetical protein
MSVDAAEFTKVGTRLVARITYRRRETTGESGFNGESVRVVRDTVFQAAKWIVMDSTERWALVCDSAVPEFNGLHRLDSLIKYEWSFSRASYRNFNVRMVPKLQWISTAGTGSDTLHVLYDVVGKDGNVLMENELLWCKGTGWREFEYHSWLKPSGSYFLAGQVDRGGRQTDLLGGRTVYDSGFFRYTTRYSDEGSMPAAFYSALVHKYDSLLLVKKRKDIK